jgi:hypothetical protein
MLLFGVEVLTAVTIKFTVFWDVTPCSLVNVYRRNVLPPFSGSKSKPRNPISNRLRGVTSQRTVLFSVFIVEYYFKCGELKDFWNEFMATFPHIKDPIKSTINRNVHRFPVTLSMNRPK